MLPITLPGIFVLTVGSGLVFLQAKLQHHHLLMDQVDYSIPMLPFLFIIVTVASPAAFLIVSLTCIHHNTLALHLYEDAVATNV